ncbi:MAG: 50S ribosomal protein L1 [Chthonomonas sp.]|nr:50S ribosomal protein L1 [Chthonomonas sp.]
MPKKDKKKAPHSKRFTALAEAIEADKMYEVAEALELVKKNATAKFPEGVDLSVRLGIDPKKGDQNVRGTTSLPHGTGKTKIVAVLAKGDHAKEAKEAGADHVGDEDLIKQIQEGFNKFDVVLATEEMAPQIGKIGKALGAKTPNKRNGTVTNAIGTAVKEIKGATRVEYRADKGGVINMPIGRVSLSTAQLTENFTAAVSAIVKAKPTSAKGKYLVTMTLSSTMGPGVPLDPALAQKVAGA